MRQESAVGGTRWKEVDHGCGARMADGRKDGGRRRRQQGGVVIEFTLVTALFLVPLLLGASAIGINLARSTQVTQVVRDVGHMFARSVDFSAPANQDMVVRLAEGLGMTRTGGSGAVILSQVMMIGQPQCAAGGFPTNCPNWGEAVIIQRIHIGNRGKVSRFGTPSSGLMDAQGKIPSASYLTESSVVAGNGFRQLMQWELTNDETSSAGQVAYLVEADFDPIDFGLPALLQFTHGVYARAIF